MTGVFVLIIVVSLIGVVANPAPYYGVVGLVVCVGIGCGVLISFGGVFIGLVLLLVYLGGMLVVFAYSAALAADPQPSHWVDYSVLSYVVGYTCVVLVVWLLGGGGYDMSGIINLTSFEVNVSQGDACGIAVLLNSGGGFLLICAWGLTLMLFVVLELLRRASYGCGRI